MFDPAELSHLEDPFPRYAELRATGPVVEILPGILGTFRYEAASELMRDPRCISRYLAARYAHLPEGALRDEMTNRINFLDPPDHPRVRGLVARAFTPRRIDAMRPWIAQTASALVDELPVAADGTVELMRGFAHDLPSLVISELLGVPVEQRDRLTALSDAVTPVFGTKIASDDLARACEAAAEMRAAMEALAAERAARPGDDLLSALLAVEEDGARLGHLELMSLVTTLYSAGHRTTRDLFGNGVGLMCARGLPLDVAPVDAIVGEMLRLATPTHFVGRMPAEPIELSGVEVPANSVVVVFLAAANRDPDVYDAPDDFRPERAGPPPLSFAFGAHYCLGASLARAEAEEMVSALLRRFPKVRSSDRPNRWHQRGPFRGFDELHVRVD